MANNYYNLIKNFEIYEMEYVLSRVFSFISSTFQLIQMLIHVGCNVTKLELCKCMQPFNCLNVCLESQNDTYQVLQ